MTSARNDGHRPKSASHSSRFAAAGGRWGTLISMISSVMAMANTPSLKASRRPVSFPSIVKAPLARFL
jgi:hypothetical protein